MKPENFIYWLQGYLELSTENQGLTPEQVEIIKRHINLVLTPVTYTKPIDNESLAKLLEKSRYETQPFICGTPNRNEDILIC